MGIHHSHGEDCHSSCANPRLDRRILWVVIALNFIMFLVEVGAGFAADSVSLFADALDFMGDTASYTIALYMLNKPLNWRAKAAFIKGSVMLLFGLWVLLMAILAALGMHQPEPFTMGAVGGAAFVVNVVSALLVFRFSNGDSNLRSVWICSRNDALGNLAVILAASGVFALSSGWPDLVVALLMSGLALWGAGQIITHARADLKRANS